MGSKIQTPPREYYIPLRSYISSRETPLTNKELTTLREYQPGEALILMNFMLYQVQVLETSRVGRKPLAKPTRII